VFRNAATVGIDLNHYVKKGLLFHQAWRPTQYGMEMHLLRIHKLIETVKPESVVMDPISNLIGTSTQRDVQSMLMRLIDFLKEKGITALMTTLTKGGNHLEGTEEQISSLIDTWILVRDVEQSGERNRCLYILKSRGMAHSNQLREFMITSQGIKLLTPYIGSGQVFTGSARLAQEAKDSAEALERKQTIERKRGELQAKRRELDARIENLRAEYAAEEDQMETLIQQAQNVEHRLELDTQEMAGSRQAGASTGKPGRRLGNGAEG
jgi:circadian clock protein KaiC